MKHRLKPPGNECRKAISVMKHSSDESVVKDNIKAALQYRQSLVCNPEKFMMSKTCSLDRPRHTWQTPHINLSLYSTFCPLRCDVLKALLLLLYFSSYCCLRLSKSPFFERLKGMFHRCLGKTSKQNFWSAYFRPTVIVIAKHKPLITTLNNSTKIQKL